MGAVAQQGNISSLSLDRSDTPQSSVYFSSGLFAIRLITGSHDGSQF
jgi:hypothetical protein